jgi:hypothetical protein
MTRVRLFGWALFVLVVLAVMLALVGCHKHSTQVVVQPVPDYTADAAGPIYDPDAVVVWFGGQRGYYDHFRIFHLLVVVGGFDGYYDSNHRFVSSAPGIRMRVQSQVKVVPPVRVVGPTVPRQNPAAVAPRPVPAASRPVLVAPRLAPAARPAGGGGGRRK